MADTKRTLDGVLALYTDNKDGLITFQAHRDLAVSFAPCYGRISQQGNASETSITDSESYFLVNFSLTVLHSEVNDFDMPANGRLRYTGNPDRVAHITVNLSIDLGGNNIGVHFKLGKNGTPDAETEMEYHKGSASTEPEISLSMLTSLSTNDYIELFISNHTNTDNVTVDYFSMTAFAHIK